MSQSLWRASSGDSPAKLVAGVVTRGSAAEGTASDSSARAALMAARMACRIETDSSSDGSPLALLPMMPRWFGESCTQ